MKNIKLYVGCNVHGVPTHTLESVCALLAQTEIENATVEQAYGFYKGELEKTVTITICDIDEKLEKYILFDVVYLLRSKLDQECIGVEKYESNFTWE